MVAKIREIQHFSETLHVTSLVTTGFKICFWQENDFLEKLPVDSAYTLQVKNFIEIALSRTVCKTNALLGFTQKFKMAAKNG